MRRRALVASLGASVAAGLAGCGAIGGGCRAPDDIHAALPRGERYEETIHTVELVERTPDGVQMLWARFHDGRDRTFVLEVVEWDSPEAAGDYVETFEEEGYSSDATVARLRVGAFTFDGFGPDREAVTSFLAASDVLSRACVERRAAWD